jgi:hypothetical protein
MRTQILVLLRMIIYNPEIVAPVVKFIPVDVIALPTITSVKTKNQPVHCQRLRLFFVNNPRMRIALLQMPSVRQYQRGIFPVDQRIRNNDLMSINDPVYLNSSQVHAQPKTSLPSMHTNPSRHRCLLAESALLDSSPALESGRAFRG